VEKLAESAPDIALAVGSFREVILLLLDAIPFVIEKRLPFADYSWFGALTNASRLPPSQAQAARH
jgi:hypothetical protein